MRSFKSISAMLAVFSLAGAAVVQADDRKFTYSYEAKTLPQGTWEFEQWATLQSGKDGGTWNTLLFREEIEYGVTDRLNGSIYLNSKYQGNRGVPGLSDESSFGFQSMSTEWKYKLSDPSTDAVGSLLYGELGFSSDEYEVEVKLVLSKEVGPFTFAYNLIYEVEVERADPGSVPAWNVEHVLSNTLGMSYSITSSLAVGVEAVDVARFAVTENTQTHAFFLGPNAHYSSGSWWITVTVLFQVGFNGLELTDGDNTKVAVRFMFGVNF
jgi:hypothetical protein